MASVLDWAYWHLGRDTTRRVLGGNGPVLDFIAPGQLPPGTPARQVAMSILPGGSFQPWDGDPLSGWHRVTLGFDARAEPEATADPSASQSPGQWCQEVLTKIRDNLLSFSSDGVPVTNDGIAVVSIGCSFEVSWIGRDDSGRELYHLEMPIVYEDDVGPVMDAGDFSRAFSEAFTRVGV